MFDTKEDEYIKPSLWTYTLGLLTLGEYNRVMRWHNHKVNVLRRDTLLKDYMFKISRRQYLLNIINK